MNEGVTISYKDEVDSILLISKKDVETSIKQFQISKDLDSLGSRILMKQTVKILDFLC